MHFGLKFRGNYDTKTVVFKDGMLFHRVFGFWPDSEEFFGFWQRFRGYAMAIITILIPFYQLTATTKMDTEKLPEYIVDCFIAVIAIFKVVPYITNRKVIHELMEMTKDINLIMRENEEEENIADSWLKIQKILVQAQAISYHSMFTMFFVMPLLRDGGFPLQGVFPEYLYVTPWFQLTYATITFAQFFRLYGVLSSNILCATFMCQLFSGFQVVQKSIEKLEKNNRSQYSNLIRRHAIALKYGEIICSHFSPVFLILILIYAMNICFCGVTAITTTNKVLVFKMSGYALMCFSEVFIFCFVGERVTTESLKIGEKLSSDAFSTYIGNVNLLKCANFSLLRAQKPLRLVVGNDGVLNLSYFSIITNKIVSFFMIFRTLFEEGRI